MYDIKPQINTLLEAIVGEDNVSNDYPDSFESLPYITFTELINSDAFKIEYELYTEIVIKIDIWNNRSTGELANRVNSAMKTVGLKRDFSGDITDPSGIKHKTMRFKGKINNKTKIMYQ